MKKKLFIISLLLLSQAACSQTKVIHETTKSSSQVDLESLKKENESLKAERGSSIVNEFNEEAAKITEELPLNYISAWAKAAFGDNTICFAYEKEYIQCIVLDPKNATKDDIQQIYDSFKTSISTLYLLTNSNSELLKFKHVSVRFVTPEDTPLIEFFLRNNNSQFEYYDTTIGLSKGDEVVKLLNEINK